MKSLWHRSKDNPRIVQPPAPKETWEPPKIKAFKSAKAGLTSFVELAGCHDLDLVLSYAGNGLTWFNERYLPICLTCPWQGGITEELAVAVEHAQRHGRATTPVKTVTEAIS
jgi:hypothetical protein